ncbi:exonuclease subunit SbcD [Synechococcus sp. PCC 6312]|uniref:exonuclease subunit SbcD n=1 Tax=Synechococcus sp. (strain ATCC 27167 / PCC 6312) TaxID=195253 RepID=UPI00029F0A3C|nr:exonuclease subunit SbcD [Synechococcus sp. PCC 6312]AFY62655.1 Exodeoxyribonuclease I subunit D [Synechococcus sp. PCC 6312]
MVKLLHLSDIHLGSGLGHGRLNPLTGLNTRLEDFVAALTYCIDQALAEAVDLVLFGGDAFPDATPPPLVQEAFAQQFRRLADAQIPTVLLVGNHDQHAQGQGGASLVIYRTLGVPGFIVGDQLSTHRIRTKQGDVQVVTLPWLTRSALLTKPETEGLGLGEVGQLLIQRLMVALAGEIRQLDPEQPTVLLAHAMVDTARFGAERFLSVGKGFTIPLSLLAQSEFDYVALGHVHRHQVLCEQPPVIYPGSIERVDFGEEGEEKGFILVEICKGQAQWQFCPIPTRPFLTLDVDLSLIHEHPQARLLEMITQASIDQAIVRLRYRLRPDQTALIDLPSLHGALTPAHSFSIHPELVTQLPRARLPELGLGQTIAPLAALELYLEQRPDLEPLKSELLMAATSLLDHQDWEKEGTTPSHPPGPASEITPIATSVQLDLLSMS